MHMMMIGRLAPKAQEKSASLPFLGKQAFVLFCYYLVHVSILSDFCINKIVTEMIAAQHSFLFRATLLLAASNIL